MRQIRVVLLLGVLLLAFSTVSAQQLIPMSDVDMYVSSELELQGFPTTGGQLESIRQEISQNITTEMNNVVEQIGRLDGTNEVGRAWLGEVEEAAGQNTPTSARDQFNAYRQPQQIDAVTGNDNRPVLPREPEGIDREARDLVNRVSDSVRDLFRSEQGELPQYQYTGQRPATGLQALAERFGAEVNAINAGFAWDEMRQRQFYEALADGTSDYINDRIQRYRNVTKRVMRRYIQVMTASQELPISGYWRPESEIEYSRSGTCQVYVCDGCGGGVVPQPEEEDPGEPLCGFPAEPPFLVWRGAEHPYLPGTSSIYSAAPDINIEIARDSNGATIRNMRTEHTTEYEVVAPDRIIVRDTFREIGGCTLTAEYALVLVRQDETVCTIIELPEEPVSTPEPETTPVPGETNRMRVGQPIYNDPAECDSENTPPAMEEVSFVAQADGSILLDYGTGQLTLYGQGFGSYEYNTGTGRGLRQVVYLNLFGGGTQGSLSWSITTNGKQCFASHDLSLPGAQPDVVVTPAPDENNQSSENGNVSNEDVFDLLPGRYRAEWTELPGLCNPDLQPLAPNFSEVTLTLPDPLTVIMDYDGGQLQLTNGAPGMFFLTQMTDAFNASSTIMPLDATTVSFSWAGADTADPSITCIVMASLIPID